MIVRVGRRYTVYNIETANKKKYLLLLLYSELQGNRVLHSVMYSIYIVLYLGRVYKMISAPARPRTLSSVMERGATFVYKYIIL